jgi:hypothetical protein
MNIPDARLGYFVGECRNETVGLTANLVMFLHGAGQSRIHGELGIYGELDGGGAFHGKIAGNSISFSTSEPSIHLVIEWIRYVFGITD